MEKKLANLFDQQRFQPNARLTGIIHDVESRYGTELEENDLELVSAAGTNTVPTVQVDVLLGRHAIPEDEERPKW